MPKLIKMIPDIFKQKTSQWEATQIELKQNQRILEKETEQMNLKVKVIRKAVLSLMARRKMGRKIKIKTERYKNEEPKAMDLQSKKIRSKNNLCLTRNRMKKSQWSKRSRSKTSNSESQKRVQYKRSARIQSRYLKIFKALKYSLKIWINFLPKFIHCRTNALFIKLRFQINRHLKSL